MKHFYLILFAVLFACELQVDVERPDFEESLVIGSLINPDSIVRVSVTKDKYILDGNNNFGVQGISGAIVNLFENGELVGTLIEQELSDDYQGTINGIYEIEYFPQVGREYRIEVEHANFRKATATESLSLTVPFFSLKEGDLSDVSGNRGSGKIELGIIIDDAPGTDYYELVGYFEQQGAFTELDSETGQFTIDSVFQIREVLYFNSDNLVFEDYASEPLIFEDKLFEGRSYEINLEFFFNIFTSSEDFDPEAVLTIELRKVSEAYFNYYNSALLQDWISDNPFAEPVQVFSNIDNGFGVFGSYVASRIEIQMEVNQ